MAPGQQPPPTNAGPAGLMEITITGIGTPQQQTSVRSVSSAQAAAQATNPVLGGPSRGARIILSGRLSTLPDTAATTHDGTVQINPVSTASFTWGTRIGGGYRYVSATYQVRNAASGGAAYGDARTNLTFLAVNTPSTLSGTAFSVLRKFDGTAAASGVETSVLPAGWADLSSSATLTSRAPDVLQVYTETEVGDLGAIAGITSVLPYGFVVNNPSTSGSRTLAANPGASQFDGLVTFAFRVPLQALATDDPYTITAVFLPVDDITPVVTQSFEETDATSVSNATARAATLGATIRSLIGTTVGSSAATFVCTVRTAGTHGSPTAALGDSVGVSSESPSPYANLASFLPANAALTATFNENMAGALPTTFVVNSFQTGRTFLSGTFSGGGTPTLGAPTGSFRAGDVLEVALTRGLQGATSESRVCGPVVYRYRVASALASAAFVADTPFAIVGDPLGATPRPIAVGDINGDGKLDLLVADYNDNSFPSGGPGSVTVFLGNGAGDFTAATGSPFDVGKGPRGMVLADFDGDGHLDIATANFTDNSVSVLLNDGHGGFQAVKTYSAGSGPQAIDAGDVNGDGKLDLVIADNSGNAVTVLLGDGSGGFSAAPGSPFTVGTGPYGVAVGDLNGDGKLDIVTANQGSETATVLLGDGTGRFTEASGSPYSMGTGSAPSAVALADVSGDGVLDLIVANSGAAYNSVAVLTGDGTGHFSAATSFSVGTTPWALAVGDVNGDGSVDIASANVGSDNVTILLNNGSGTFTQATGSPFSVGVGPRGITLGDFKNDGKLGVAAANFGDGSATVLFNP